MRGVGFIWSVRRGNADRKERLENLLDPTKCFFEANVILMFTSKNCKTLTQSFDQACFSLFERPGATNDGQLVAPAHPWSQPLL